MATAVASTTGNNDFVNSLSNPSAASASNGTDMSERFLKLLVTQMQNQDPLNPLDNAQVTTQMAQINTVSGIEKLNTSINSMSTALGDKLGSLSIGTQLDALNKSIGSLQGQMLQSQASQGAALVGHTVLLSGNAMNVDANGMGAGAVELSAPADRTVVDVLGPAGQVIDTVDLGALPSGRSVFGWKAPPGASTDGLTFRVRATSGAATVPASTLSADTVNSVSAGGSGLVLDLARTGSVPFTQVKAVS